MDIFTCMQVSGKPFLENTERSNQAQFNFCHKYTFSLVFLQILINFIQGRKKSKVKGTNGEAAGSSGEIKGVLKRTQTFRVANPSTSSQIHSTAPSNPLSSTPGHVQQSGGSGTSIATSPAANGGAVSNQDESGSNTTATTIGCSNIRREGSLSIAARGQYFFIFPRHQMIST